MKNTHSLTYDQLLLLTKEELLELASDAKSRRIIQKVMRNRHKKHHNRLTYMQTQESPNAPGVVPGATGNKRRAIANSKRKKS